MAALWRELVLANLNLLLILSAIFLVQSTLSTSRFAQYMGDCPEEYHQKGMVLSLFGTISALNKIKQEGLYDVDYVLGFGTLIAFHRNSTLLPWDFDSDISLIFQEDLNQKELKKFGKVLQQKFREVLNTPDMGRVKWVFQKHYEGFRHHTMWVRAVNASFGMTDVFLFFHGDKPGQIVTYHPFHHTAERVVWEVEKYGDAQKEEQEEEISPVISVDESWFFPIRTVPWTAYGGFPVNIPESLGPLEAAYGKDWRVPNVDEKKLSCQQANRSTIDTWLARFRDKSDREPQQSNAPIAVPDHDETVPDSVYFELSWYQYAWQLMLYCTVVGLFCRLR